MQSGPNCKKLVGRLRPQAPENQSLRSVVVSYSCVIRPSGCACNSKKKSPYASYAAANSVWHRGCVIVLGFLPAGDLSLLAGSHVPEHRNYIWCDSVLWAAVSVLRVRHGFSKPLHFLAESSANVCNFEIQQRGALLEIRAKCWQPANKTPESVSRRASEKKKSARFC